MTAEKARELVANAKFILLDFDGPVTPLMPYPLNMMCYQRALSAFRRHSEESTQTDYMDVLRKARGVSNECMEEVETASIMAEIECAQKSELTSGIAEFLQILTQTRKISIVSNNSTQSIQQVLNRFALCSSIYGIHGRPPMNPEKMKPSTYLLRKAVDGLGMGPQSGVFIGDSISDVEAARKIKMPVVAMVRNELKRSALASADSLVESIEELF